MSNKTRTVLYIGVTNDLSRRVAEHREGSGSAFTSKYKCYDLVYMEEFLDINDAIAREKQLKGWGREKKDNLIKSLNPELENLTL